MFQERGDQVVLVLESNQSWTYKARYVSEAKQAVSLNSLTHLP